MSQQSANDDIFGINNFPIHFNLNTIHFNLNKHPLYSKIRHDVSIFSILKILKYCFPQNLLYFRQNTNKELSNVNFGNGIIEYAALVRFLYGFPKWIK